MIDLSDGDKILLLILLVAVAIYFFSSSSKADPIHNEGMLTQDPVLSNNFNDMIDVSNDQNNDNNDNNSSNGSNGSNGSKSSSIASNVTSESNASTNSNSDLAKKMTPVRSFDGYKYSSYSKGDRGTKSNELDKFFEGNYPKDANTNNGFSPVVENDGQYAAYTSGKPKKLTDKDKFDPNSLLPREKNTDLFDDPYEQATSKSSRLINIYRPVGVNTVQTTKKLATHDIRGNPPTPKFNISPFLNSSVDTDNNFKNEALCR